MKLLFISTPVGALGSGQGGGVELTVQNVAQEMQRRGHKLQVVASAGSKLKDIFVQGIEGNLQIPVQTQTRDVPICLPANSVLGNMLVYAYQVQSEYDMIVNFAFDWLPFYLTPFFTTPIAHFISMGSMTIALDEMMNKIAHQYPNTIGVYTKSQADTFPFSDRCEILSSAIDLSLYEFCAEPGNSLAWLGRIAPEKALEDAVEAATKTGIKLRIFGKIQDKEYWNQIKTKFNSEFLEYVGFLETKALQQELRQARALLMTPRWVEAFGNVAIEALACGVPVIAYARGGPAEIVKDGETGFLVKPDSVTGLIEAINRIDEIKRDRCRQQAESEYSLTALGDRFEVWFTKILKSSHN
jgi:UDP-glucose:tetrahydrobiopterin glucosyltransferase